MPIDFRVLTGHAVAVMKRVIASIAALLALAGCTGPSGSPPFGLRMDLAEAVRAVDAADGIDQAEATAIAAAYYYSNIDFGCGTYRATENTGRFWVAPVVFGYAAQPVDPIVIDKQTGAVAWGDRTATLAEVKAALGAR